MYILDTNKTTIKNFTLVDNYILEAGNLEGMEQILYIHLKKYSSKSIEFFPALECFPANATLCKKLKCSTNTVRRILKSLETKGYIAIYKRFNNSNIYLLLPLEEMQEKELPKNALLEFYKKNINPDPGDLEKQIIINWQVRFKGNSELIFKAMSIAVDENAKKLKYIEAILRDWEKNKIETLEQANIHIKSRNQKWNFTKCKKEDTFNAYQQRSYDFEELENKLLGFDSKSDSEFG